MADTKISALPNGNLISSTIFPIVTNGITSKTTFSEIQSEIGGGNSYVLGFETYNERGTTITIGKGVGKIRFTNGSNAFVGVDGASFNGDTIGSVSWGNQMTIILGNNERRYISINNIIDDTNGVIDYIYFDNQQINGDTNFWNLPSGDYEYYPYFISSSSSNYSFAEGESTQANGLASHAEGRFTQAFGNSSHAEGSDTQANGFTSHAEGQETQANGDFSHAEGRNTIADGFASHAEGNNTQAIGGYSHSEGNGTQAFGTFSHAEGYNTIASGQSSHAEGSNTIANGSGSHAEGSNTQAIGQNSHAEGQETQAIGNLGSHAEGYNTIASGQSSHSEGFYTQAIDDYSHAGGGYTFANGFTSFVHGYESIVNGDYSIVLGRNITGDTADTTYVDNINIKNILTLNTIVTPSNLIDGQIWLEDSGLKIRISGITKTFTLS